MEKIDEFIEIEDNETLFGGNEHLKINIPISKEKKVEQQNTEVEEENLIDTDEYLNSNNDEDDEDEKTVSTKKVEGKKITPEETDNSDSEDAIIENEFSAFASLLNESGFFPDIEDEELVTIKSEDELQEKLARQLNKTFIDWQDSYKQNLIDNLVKDGHIKKGEVDPNLIMSYSKEDIKGNLEVAKKVHDDFYRRKGLSDKQIKTIISGTEDLEDSALELFDELEVEKNKEKVLLAAKLKEQEGLAAKQRIEFAENLKKNTFEYEEFIPGRKLRKQDKQEVFDNIEPVLKKINQNLFKYAPLLSYLDRYGMLDGSFDKILKEGQTQSVTKLEQILKDKKRGTTINKTNKNGIVNIDNSDTKQIYK